MRDFNEIVKITSAPSGKVCHRKFIQALEKTKHYKKFLAVKSEYPELPWKALQYIYSVGKRPTCKCCPQFTSWHAHSGAYFNTYCSARCQNTDPDKVSKQVASHRTQVDQERKVNTKFVADLYKDLTGKVTTKVTDAQQRAFVEALSKTTFKREHELLALLPRGLQKLWINLPASSTRSRLLMATGQIELTAECAFCGKSLTKPSFYGWSTYCDNDCSNKAVGKHRYYTTATYGAMARANAERQKDPVRSKEYKDRREATWLERYGVKCLSHLPGVRDKQRASMPKAKEVKLGNRVVRVQGYEPQALAMLLTKYTPSQIYVESEGKVPSIRYTRKSGKTRIHYPDMYIPKENRLIEVKSTYWLYGTQDRWYLSCAKARAAKEQGFLYNLMLVANGKYVKLPSKWWELTWGVAKKLIASEIKLQAYS